MTLSPNPTIDYDLDYLNDFEKGFPAIVYDDGLTSKSDLGIKPLVSFENIDEFNLNDETSLSEYDEEIISRFNDLFNDIHFDNSKSKIDDDDNNIDMAPLPAADQRHPWLRYEDLAVRMRMVYSGEGQQAQLGGARRRMTWRQFILALGLHTEQEMAKTGDFLGPDPSYVLIRDPVRRLCYKMIAYSISGRGQAPEKVTGVDLFYLRNMDHKAINVPHLLAQYLFRHEKGRKSGARLSSGYFIGHLAMHFGLLGRLHICTRYGDTWTWVAQGPERQQAATADAPEAGEDGQGAEEVALEIPAPVRAPPPAPQPQTMSQRIERLEEEVHDLRRDFVGLQGDVTSFTTEQSRVSTGLISCMTQLMDASGQTYQPFDSTFISSSGLSFQRCVRPRTGEASTFAAPHTNAQPDP
ncbi:hypothetical protein Tco_0191352 [Tanacetum coccineum]